MHGIIIVTILSFIGAIVNAQVIAVPEPAEPVAPSQADQPQFEAQVVYGADGRGDLYQVTDPKILMLADSTVILIRSYNVEFVPERKIAMLRTMPYSTRQNLCTEERFYDQKTIGYCSGALIAPDIVLTAGHCVIPPNSCSTAKFVFGFGIRKMGVFPDFVPASEVYSCAKIITGMATNAGPDWALVQLDRPVPNHRPLKLNRTGIIVKNTPIFTIGHPAGLPTKVSFRAIVRNVTPNSHFVTNLDTYAGNSGGPVFNAWTNLIEGVLVRGDVDYVWKGSCRVSNVNSNSGGRGEDVTMISTVLPYIPSTVRIIFFGEDLTDPIENVTAVSRDIDFDQAQP